HGATLVERVRTFGRKIPDIKLHKDRLHAGLKALGIQGSSFMLQIDSALEQLIASSATLLNQESDASLCIVVTPGDYYSGTQLQGFIHWLPIPWNKLASWYQSGTTLVRVQYASGAGECWPANIKTRSRLNYFLADQDAQKRFDGSLALLCTSRGMVADTSVANVLLVDQQSNIWSPIRQDILEGTSLKTTQELLLSLGKEIQFRDILFEEIYEASEVLLVGNTGCLWHASHFQRREIGLGTPGPICLSLQKLWCQSIGFDWKSQAILKSKS
ncbi:MAG: aminotransferase class IV, partial [Pirellula sp.]